MPKEVIIIKEENDKENKTVELNIIQLKKFLFLLLIKGMNLKK